MAEIVNLRLVKKRQARALRDAEAAANRARFGTPKSEVKSEKATKALEARRLDGHKRDDTPSR